MVEVLGDRYLLQEVIGAGGAGAVWRAVDQRLERSVAVKVVALDGGLDVAAEQRFRREVMVTAGLDHPNLVTVLDAGSSGRSLYSVMELLPGPSLAEELDRHGPLPVAVVVDYAQQICAGLTAAHAAGVIHRDLKPANVVMASSGWIKLVDFGIARIVAETTQVDLTAPSTVVGTAAYVSPEAASGGRVDARSDLYALGCLLFALLSGRPPFGGDTPVQTLSHHINAPVPELVGRPDIPPALATLITALLAKDPAGRPASAADVWQRLEDGRLSVSPHEAPTDVLPAENRRLPRSRLLLASGAAMVVGLLAWAGVVLADGPRHPHPTTTTTTPTRATSTTVTAPSTVGTTTASSTITTTSLPSTPHDPKPNPGHGPPSGGPGSPTGHPGNGKGPKSHP